jgi:hypothetical protein
MYVTAGAILALGNTATGFTIGWILALMLRLNPQAVTEQRQG